MTPKKRMYRRIDKEILKPSFYRGNAWLPGNGAAPWSQAASARNLEQLEAVWKLFETYAKWIPMGIPLDVPMDVPMDQVLMGVWWRPASRARSC